MQMMAKSRVTGAWCERSAPPETWWREATEVRPYETTSRRNRLMVPVVVNGTVME